MSQNCASENTGDPLSATMQGMLRLPAFDAAARLYLEHILSWRRDLGVFNRVATTSGLHTIGYLIFLHFSNTSGRPENGATYSRLLEICEARETCGSRALRTILVLAQVMGYLQSSRASTDRRIQIFTPTEKLITQSRQQFSIPFACLDMLVPGQGYAQAVKSDLAFLPKLYASAGKAFLDHDIDITGFFPELHELMQLQGGCPFILAISHAAAHGREIPTTAAIAKEFHISLTQVRTVLKAGASRGLITLSERGQVMDASPLVAQQKAMIARELSLYAKYSLGLEDCFLNTSAANAPPQKQQAGGWLQAIPG